MVILRNPINSLILAKGIAIENLLDPGLTITLIFYFFQQPSMFGILFFIARKIYCHSFGDIGMEGCK